VGQVDQVLFWISGLGQLGQLDQVLSWVIGLGNPLTALAVGPTIMTFWGPTPGKRVVKVGWCALFVTQSTFLAFGFASGYMAFMIAQPMMIPISAWNYYLTVSGWATRQRGQRERRVVKTL
jgi:hypothetical protein